RGRDTVASSVPLTAGGNGDSLTGQCGGFGSGPVVCGSCPCALLRLCTDRTECARYRADQPPPGWNSSGIGVGSGTRQGAVGRADRGPTGGSFPAADGRKPDGAAAPANASRSDGLELRPAERRGTDAAGATVGIHRRMDPGSCGASLRKTTFTT